jgi:outer membrane receptor protein involved in Fe transport
VLPERSHVFDVGVDQVVLTGLTVSVDAYYKRATDLLDDGQFGAALVLDAFNYAKGENTGVEVSAKYVNGTFNAYANFAAARQVAKDPISNQYLWDPDEFVYAQNNYVHTDHAQTYTASAGASYRLCGTETPTDLTKPRGVGPDWWCGTRLSADMIYGSGLRAGFANTDHVPPYTQVNLGILHDFNIIGANKPTTLRLDVVNLFDTTYLIRDGSGIGVFASQYGPRRGIYAGLTQKF